MLDPFHDRETALPRIPKQPGGRGMILRLQWMEKHGVSLDPKLTGLCDRPSPERPASRESEIRNCERLGRPGRIIYTSGKAGKAGKNIRPTEVHLRSELSISNPSFKGSSSYYTLMSIFAMDRHPTVYRLQVLTVAPKA